MNILQKHFWTRSALPGCMALMLVSLASQLAAQTPTSSTTTAAAPAGNYGEQALLAPRRIASEIIAASNHHPTFVVSLGAHQGEFLEVFLDRFPEARGQWTEPKENVENHNIDLAKTRLARFGDRVSYHIGCYGRDLADNCLPQQTDAIITDWMSINQNLDGLYRIYRLAADGLPQGGWLVNLDHVAFSSQEWNTTMKAAGKSSLPGLEGPPIKFAAIRVPTVEEQLGAMRAAGFDAQAVWQSYSTVLFIGRKR